MKIKKILFSILILVILYFVWTQFVNIAISKWWTNSSSSEIELTKSYENDIPSELWQVHKYLLEHKEHIDEVVSIYTYLQWSDHNGKWFPYNNWWLDFVIEWMDNRPSFSNSIIKYSTLLWLDKDLVMWCVMAEQIRIANKGARWSLKHIVMWMTPRPLRSNNVSLGIGWIKLETAYQIKKDADKYWYGTWLYWSEITTETLTNNDAINAKYAVYLVKNILTRWQLSWYDISDKPGVVWTIYNIGNRKDKIPNANPKIWWAVINIWWRDFVYGWLAEWVYWYRKIFINNK